MANGIFGYILGLALRFDEAVAQTKVAIEIAPKVMLPTKQLGMCTRSKASRTAQRRRWKRRSSWIRQPSAAEAISCSGTRSWADGMTHLVYGEYDAAMTSLERGVAERGQLMAAMSVPCDPLFDPLKSNPRFAVLMQRIGARACPATVNWPAMLPPRPGQRSPAR
jgi:hypothetical protein